MRQDIQKVICERQQGNSSERSQKTGMKVNPKFFINHHNRKHKGTFEEFRARMLELSDCWDDSDIIGGVDYGSFDWGPNHVSSARRRQEGRCSGLPNATGLYHKRHNENTKPLYRFLTKAVGRPWNDVYSEVCTHVDRRSDVGYNVLRHLDWAVAQDIEIHNGKPYQTRWGRRSSDYPYSGLYVHPETGILCEYEREPYVRPEPEVTSIHWHDNVWFQLEVLKDRNLECGCRHFKVPPPPEDKNKKYYSYWDKPAVCHHGNEPTPRPIWYVYTYTWHDPNEVYRVIHSYDYEAERYGMKRTEYTRNGEKNVETHTIYYRDVPDILAKPIVFRKKVANRKELALIHEYLEGGGVNQPSPNPEPKRYSPWSRRPLIP